MLSPVSGNGNLIENWQICAMSEIVFRVPVFGLVCQNVFGTDWVILIYIYTYRSPSDCKSPWEASSVSSLSELFYIRSCLVVFIKTKDLYTHSRKYTNLVFSHVARFYATTEQNLIHSFWNALRICRKINQLHQSLCYTKKCTSTIYYTTQNNP